MGAIRVLLAGQQSPAMKRAAEVLSGRGYQLLRSARVDARRGRRSQGLRYDLVVVEGQGHTRIGGRKPSREVPTLVLVDRQPTLLSRGVWAIPKTFTDHDLLARVEAALKNFRVVERNLNENFRRAERLRERSAYLVRRTVEIVAARRGHKYNESWSLPEGVGIGHSDEGSLEEYLFGRKSGDESEAITRHLLVCETCQARLIEAARFIHAIRSAAKQWVADQRRSAD